MAQIKLPLFTNLPAKYTERIRFSVKFGSCRCGSILTFRCVCEAAKDAGNIDFWIKVRITSDFSFISGPTGCQRGI